MAKLLHFCMLTAGIDCKENRHPQLVMRELGITYQHSVPQSISDSWEFWNCENVPAELPPYLALRDWDPMKRIGWGLSAETAKLIAEYQSPQSEAPGDQNTEDS